MAKFPNNRNLDSFSLCSGPTGDRRNEVRTLAALLIRRNKFGDNLNLQLHTSSPDSYKILIEALKNIKLVKLLENPFLLSGKKIFAVT